MARRTLASARKKQHHAGQKPVTIWLPDALAAMVDEHLQAMCAGRPGVKASRQAWIVSLIERELEKRSRRRPSKVHRRIVGKLVAGGAVPDVAAAVGLSERQVQRLAVDCGLNRPRGRPRKKV